MKMWWNKGRGFSWSGPWVIWEVKKCKVCGEGKYASTRAVTWIVRNGIAKKVSSTLAKRGADGLWRGVDRGVGGRTKEAFYDLSYEDQPILRPVSDKPILACVCISKSGRIPKRLIDLYLSPPPPAPNTPYLREGSGTFTDNSAGNSAGPFRPRRQRIVDAGAAGDKPAGRASGRRRPNFMPVTEEQVAQRQAITDREMADIAARLDKETQEELDNDTRYSGAH